MHLLPAAIYVSIVSNLYGVKNVYIFVCRYFSLGPRGLMAAMAWCPLLPAWRGSWDCRAGLLLLDTCPHGQSQGSDSCCWFPSLALGRCWGFCLRARLLPRQFLSPPWPCCPAQGQAVRQGPGLLVSGLNQEQHYCGERPLPGAGSRGWGRGVCKQLCEAFLKGGGLENNLMGPLNSVGVAKASALILPLFTSPQQTKSNKRVG